MEPNSIQSAVDAGKALVATHLVDNYKPMVTAPYLPNGAVLLQPEKLVHPRFLTASPTFHEAKAFIDYVNAFKYMFSRIFYQQEGVFLAVIDYHDPNEDATGDEDERPWHGDHIAKLILKRSPEWLQWAGHSEKAMTQQEFAEFLEDAARDILQPGPEKMLEIATGLQAKMGAEFRSAINQADGTIQLQYDETVQGQVRGSQEEIPKQFQVALRPFMGTERYPIDCRLRYRITSGALRLHYKALHLEPITEAALEAIVLVIGDQTGIRPALGAHDAAAFLKGL